MADDRDAWRLEVLQTARDVLAIDRDESRRAVLAAVIAAASDGGAYQDSRPSEADYRLIIDTAREILEKHRRSNEHSNGKK